MEDSSHTGNAQSDMVSLIRQQQQKANDNQSDNEGPDELHPLGVGDAGHTQHSDQHARGGGDHVGDAVAELEG